MLKTSEKSKPQDHMVLRMRIDAETGIFFLFSLRAGRGLGVVTWPELKMSATEEDTELRDLLIQNLENNGVLNKIKVLICCL